MASNNLFDLSAKISVDAKNVDSTLANTEKKVQNLANAFQKTDTVAKSSISNLAQSLATTNPTVAKFTGVVEGLGGALGSTGAELSALAGPLGIAAAGMLATAAAGATLIKGLVDLTISTAQWEGDLYDLSQQLGVSASTLDALSMVAETTGGNIDSITQSIFLFETKMAEAQDLTSKAGQEFKKLNITSRDTGTAIGEAVKALYGMGEGYQQANTAAELFGKRGGKAFVAMAKESKGDIGKLKDELIKLNIVMDDAAYEKADALNDQFKKLERQARGTGAAIGNEMIPRMMRGLQELSAVLDKNKRSITLLADATSTFIGLPIEGFVLAQLNVLRGLAAVVDDLAGAWNNAKRALLGYFGAAAQPGTVIGGLVGGAVGGAGNIIGAAGVPLSGDISIGAGILRKKREGGGGGRGGSGGISATQQLYESLRNELERLTTTTREAEVRQQLLNEKFKDGSPALKELAIQTAKLIDVKKALQEFDDRKKASDEELKTLQQQWVQEILNARLGLDQYDNAIERVMNSLIGYSDAERAAIRAQLEHNAAILRAVQLTRERIALQDTLNKRLERPRWAEEQNWPRNIGIEPSTGGETRPRRVLGPTEEQMQRIRDMASQITYALDNAIYEGFQGGIKRGLASLLTSMLDMIKNVLMKRIEEQLTEALSNISIGAGGGGKGGIFSSIFGVILGGLGGLGGIFGGGGGTFGGAAGHPATVGGSTIGHVGSHAMGLDFVPYDNYPALLHRGEKVLTAQENSGGHTFVFNIQTPNAASFAGRDTQAQISHKMQSLAKQASVRVS